MDTFDKNSTRAFLSLCKTTNLKLKKVQAIILAYTIANNNTFVMVIKKNVREVAQNSRYAAGGIWNALVRDWNIPGHPCSRFTRCLHYLAAFVEHVHRSACSLPFPVTLENVFSVRRRRRRARFLGSMACETAPASSAGNVASTKFPLVEASNGTLYPVVLAAVLPRGVPLTLVGFHTAVASSLLRLIYLFATLVLGLPRLSLFILSSFFHLPLSLLPTSASNFVSPDIPELLVLAPFP